MNIKIFSGSNYTNLSNEICDLLNIKIGDIKIDQFSDGEILPCFKESIRDEDIFFINSTATSDSIIESLLVVDAAKRAGCKSFTLIAPYQGYSRQDKTDHLRSSIGSKMLSDIFEKAGVNRLITIDLHASSIQGFYNIPVIHLNGNKVFIDHIKSLDLDNLCVLSPDQGGVKRASDFCKAFPDATFAIINKKRIKPNEIHSMELVGDVTGKNVIIFDDLADTVGTMKKAADLIMKNGALSVRAVATHGVLSGPAMDNLMNSKITEMIVSDTINTTLSKANDKLKVVSCSKLIANSIRAISQKKSIHELNLI
jgi:ribose-phosphate pyrophosphokinase